MNTETLEQLKRHVAGQWALDGDIVRSIGEYIRIPNQSPAFDPQWATNGLLDQAADHILQWIQNARVPGLKAEKISVAGRTPLLFLELDATPDYTEKDTVFIYGHLDKQPPLENDWAEGLHPYQPVVRDGKLYGRGGADDGYAAYSAVSALQFLVEQKQKRARTVVFIEAAEESGSPDLEFHLKLLQERIGNVSLVVCLDSGCGDYNHLWITESLRGVVAGELKVQILKEGVHSGHASGIAPSSFRILRHLLDRVENSATGNIRDGRLNPPVPVKYVEQSRDTALLLGDHITSEFKWVDGAHAVSGDATELLVNRNWRAQLAVTGADGLPTPDKAGNVLRPFTSVILSMRVPPYVDPAVAGGVLKQLLEENPPYGAQVTFTVRKEFKGFMAPPSPAWQDEALEQLSVALWGEPAKHLSEGGSIPFLSILATQHPRASFFVTGVLGPETNAHGPNEMFPVSMAEKVTASVAGLLAAHASRPDVS